MKIVAFGGTFDPPHKGHTNLARSIIDHYYADKVLFIPAPTPPHKRNKQITPFEQRCKMLRLALGDDTLFEVSELEERRLPEPSFTVKTMQELVELYPDDEVVWLLGADSLNQLHKWYKSTELVRNFSLMVYPRPGDVISFDYLKRHWPDDLAQKLFDSVVELPVFDISSTEIRAAVVSGEKDVEFMDSAVLDYITKEKLYV